MACEATLKPRQTAAQRRDEVKRAVDKLNSLLGSGTVKVAVSKDGGIIFSNWNVIDRDGVTDACALRQILRTGSVSVKLAIAKAEQLAGRTLDKAKIAAGYHTHDGGRTWHNGH